MAYPFIAGGQPLMGNSSGYFRNYECEYFPCHKVSNDSDFNCLFCYCPLYSLGENCGGAFFINSKGKKDCTNCLIPHGKNSRDYIIERLKNNGND